MASCFVLREGKSHIGLDRCNYAKFGKKHKPKITQERALV